MAAPKILLLDEPASGMSTTEKERFQRSLLTLHRESGLTMVIIEHDVGFLAGMCTKLLALDFGKVIAFGPVQEVVTSPAVISAYLGTEERAAVA
jgi:ABC-type branched-subunit amino acid transport system ATPase component